MFEFDEYTVVLLVDNPDEPGFSDEERARLQDAHMSYLADLHEAGHLLAVGPAGGEGVRGVSIVNVSPEKARELKEADPAVRAGVFAIRVTPWRVPAGLVSFTPGRLPRSIAEVTGVS
jgi:uncharacterized protein